VPSLDVLTWSRNKLTRLSTKSASRRDAPHTCRGARGVVKGGCVCKCVCVCVRVCVCEGDCGCAGRNGIVGSNGILCSERGKGTGCELACVCLSL